MGTCSSIQKKKDCAAKASNGVCFKAKEVSIPSPMKEKASKEENPVNLIGVLSPQFGSKEETFFDSKVCLDTDGEDEFLSVNGDFTPRCSTSNCESIKLMTQNKPLSLENFLSSKPEPSPTGRKKLADLLWETSQGERTAIDEHQRDANNNQNSSDKLANSSLQSDVSVMQCCLPSSVQVNGFNLKKKMNPLHCCA